MSTEETLQHTADNNESETQESKSTLVPPPMTQKSPVNVSAAYDFLLESSSEKEDDEQSEASEDSTFVVRIHS